jgi:hypothetical protein
MAVNVLNIIYPFQYGDKIHCSCLLQYSGQTGNVIPDPGFLPEKNLSRKKKLKKKESGNSFIR